MDNNINKNQTTSVENQNNNVENIKYKNNNVENKQIDNNTVEKKGINFINHKQKNKKTKIFLLILILTLLLIGSYIIYYKFLSSKNKTQTENNELENIKNDNYLPEDVSIIKTLNVSKNTSFDEKNSDHFYDDALFVGSSFFNLLSEYIDNKNPNILGKSIFLYNENISINGLMESVSEESVHPLYNNEKSKIDDVLAKTNYKKLFLMIAENDLKKNSVSKTLNNYIKFIEDVKKNNKDIKIYIISELYYNKNEEDNNINNSLIRELNYKIDKINSSLKIEYINYSHAIINSTGYVTTAFYEKGKFKDEAFNVFINIMREYASNIIEKENIDNAYNAVNSCKEKLTYECYEKAKKYVDLLNNGTEKTAYKEQLSDILKEIDKKSSTDLSAIYINGNKIEITESTEYTYKVQMNTEEVIVTADAVSYNAKIEGTNTFKVEKGSNTIRINVKNKEQSKTYTLIIERPADTKINKVQVDGKDVDLNTLIVEIDKNTKFFQLDITPNDKKATIEGDGRIDLDESINYVIFKVNGFTYTLIIEKK